MESKIADFTKFLSNQCNPFIFSNLYYRFMEKNEIKLIENCKRGDSFAQEWMYKKYSGIMLAVCMRYLNNRMDAEDIMHESFISIFIKIDQLKNNELFEIWAKRIVVNNALSFLKKQVHFSSFEYDIEDDYRIDAEPESIKDKILNLEIPNDKMLSLINEMPLGFRSVFNLYVFEKYMHHEIADMLNISVGTSKSQLQRARQLLQKKLFELINDKHRPKKKETIVLSAIIFGMNTDLEYIDSFAQKNLEGISITPEIFTAFGTVVKFTETPLIGTAVKTKLLTIFSKYTYWVTSALIGIPIAVIILSVTLQKPEMKATDSLKIENTPIDLPKIQEQKTQLAPTTTDVSKNADPKTAATSLQEPIIQKSTDTIQIKKTIKVKKKVIVQQSINKSDTVFR